MKEADEIVKYLDLEFDSEINRKYYSSIIANAIKQAQVDAWNEALDKAAENVKLLEQSNWGKYENIDSSPYMKEKDCIKINNYGHGDCTYQIITPSKQSILKLKI